MLRNDATNISTSAGPPCLKIVAASLEEEIFDSCICNLVCHTPWNHGEPTKLHDVQLQSRMVQSLVEDVSGTVSKAKESMALKADDRPMSPDAAASLVQEVVGKASASVSDLMRSSSDAASSSAPQGEHAHDFGLYVSSWDAPRSSPTQGDHAHDFGLPISSWDAPSSSPQQGEHANGFSLGLPSSDNASSSPHQGGHAHGCGPV